MLLSVAVCTYSDYIGAITNSNCFIVVTSSVLLCGYIFLHTDVRYIYTINSDKQDTVVHQ